MNYQFSVKMKQVTKFCTHSSRITCARSGVEVVGLTVDREIRIRFLAYPHHCRISDGKEVKDNSTDPVPVFGWLGTLKIPSCT